MNIYNLLTGLSIIIGILLSYGVGLLAISGNYSEVLVILAMTFLLIGILLALAIAFNKYLPL